MTQVGTNITKLKPRRFAPRRSWRDGNWWRCTRCTYKHLKKRAILEHFGKEHDSKVCRRLFP